MSVVSTAPAHRTTPHRAATVAAVLLGLFFAGAGAMRLLPITTDQALFIGWGLPPWLRTGAAAAELLAGVLLLVPRLRAIGGAGAFTIMVAAGTVHAALGHSMVLAALLNGSIALAGLAVFWANRRDLAAL